MKVLVVLFLLGFLTISLRAQNGPSIYGKVTNSNGPVSSAKVTLTKETDKTKKYTFQTGENGEFRFHAPPGKYLLDALKTGVGGIVSSSTTIVEIELDNPRIVELILVESGPVQASVTVNISADTSQPLEEISKSVNVIDGQEMRDRADITLVDSLRTIPGFRVQQLGGFGRTASIKSRGLRNQDTAILIDGVRLRDAASITGDASAFLSDLTLTSVSRVEVLRGPGSSLYGTNAIGGTVDFQTPVPQGGWHGQVSGAAGGLGLGRFRGNVSHGTSGGKFGFNAAVSRTVYASGIDGDDDANNTNFQARMEYDPFSKTNISARFFVSDAFVSLNSGPDTLGTPPANTIIDAVPNVNFAFDANDPDSSQRSKFFNGQFVVTQAVNSELAFQGYYSGLTTRRTNDNGVLGTGFQSASTSVFEGTIHTVNGHVDWTPNGYNRFTVGYEFEQENFKNEGFTPSGTDDFFTDASQSSSTIYFQDLIRLFDGKLQFAGGFRAQFFSLSTPGFSLANAPYTNLVLRNPPSAYTFDGSASYYLSTTGTKLRVHVGNGYRVPSLYERFGTFYSTFGGNRFVPIGAPDLEPEKSAAFDAGIEQDLFDKRVRLSATLFYTKLGKTIGYGLLPQPDPFGRVNFDSGGGYLNTEGGIARGLEISADLEATPSTNIFASYTYTNSDQRRPQVLGSGVLRTLGIPLGQFTLTATQRIKRFWINADLLVTSAYLAPIFSNSSFNTYIYRFDGNGRLDMTAGYTFSLSKDKFSLRVFGTLENVLDYEYFENGFRTAGINGRVGVSFGF